MRRTSLFLAASGIASLGWLLPAAGCATISDFYEECTQDGGLCKSHQPPADAGGPKPVCVGSPTDIDEATGLLRAFDNDCAVFAWAGSADASPDGTMEHPFPKLQD